MRNSLLEQEAELFSRYLLNRSPDKLAVELYSRAIKQTSASLTPQDQKLLPFLKNNTWSMGIIDSGLAFINPHSEIRRRLYFMLSILESIPENHDLFLPKKRNQLYLIVVVYHGTRATIKALLGSLLIKMIA